MHSRDAVWLVGLDFGSTTTSAMVATARVVSNCVTGRMEFGELTVHFRPEPVFTPFIDDRIDTHRLGARLDAWIRESAIEPHDVTSGGAIVTGLAAQKANAAAVTRLVRERFGNALVATADDPCLESWLAFMGNCLPLSISDPKTPYLNLDVGGGTTNLAWGLAGDVKRVGCYFIGARHFQFLPGSYRITALSAYAARLLADLNIHKVIGDVLADAEREAVLDFYIGTLEAIVRSDADLLARTCVQFHQQVAFAPVAGPTPVITISGGVGELAYRRVRAEPLPSTTYFGDFGIDLAERIVESPRLSQHLRSHQPVSLGRATVLGLTIHNTEVSGTTLFLKRPESLPVTDLPILGTLNSEQTDSDLLTLLELAARTGGGACLQVDLATADQRAVKTLGTRLASTLRSCRFPKDRPLVLLVSKNVGKTLGNYATEWGSLDVALIAIDEIPVRRAHFASVGRPVNHIVPVSFYGMHAEE